MNTLGDTIILGNTGDSITGDAFCADAPANALPTEKLEKLIKRRASGLPRMGKPKLPTEKRRVFVSVRVLPKTKHALESLITEGGAKNLGWALDNLVDMAQEAGLFKIPTTFI